MNADYCSWVRALDENWYHLLVPEGISPNTGTIKDVKPFVPIETINPEDFGYFQEHSLGNDSGYQNAILEKTVGCETGAVIYFSGNEMVKEIEDIRERLERRRFKS